MNEQKEAIVSSELHLLENIREKVTNNKLRIKPNVVLRLEEDGAILFNPKTGAMSAINITATALLRWRPDKICCDEWCQRLSGYYKNIDPTQIRTDLINFLVLIYDYLEPYDEEIK